MNNDTFVTITTPDDSYNSVIIGLRRYRNYRGYYGSTIYVLSVCAAKRDSWGYRYDGTGRRVILRQVTRASKKAESEAFERAHEIINDYVNSVAEMVGGTVSGACTLPGCFDVC